MKLMKEQVKNNQPMNFFINRAMGIGNSGVEHAQFYRARRFDEVGLPYRYIFVQLINNLHEAMDTWNLKNDQVINMYEYFVLGDDYLHQGVQKFYPVKNETVVDGTNTTRLLKVQTASGMKIIETMVKFPNKEHNLLIMSLSKVEIYSSKTGEKKVTFDFYDNGHKETLIKNIHLYNQNGHQLYFPNEVQLQRYFFEQVDKAYGHSNNWFLDRGEESEAALLYPKMPQSKVVEVVHADHLSDRNDPRYPLWNNYYEYSLTHLDNIDKIISATKMQTNDLIEDFPNKKDKFATIPVGGVADKGSSKTRPRARNKKLRSLKLITASRLAGEKHIDMLVMAVAKVHKQGKTVSLDIYGAGGEKDLIEKTIKKEKAESYIKLKGLSKHLEDVYPKYDAFISASFSEGFGLTTVEALSAGLPVIAFKARFGALEMIQDGVNGFLQDFKRGDDNVDFDVKSLANGINRLLKSNYSQVQKATISSMASFQNHVIANKWKEFVDALRANQ